MMGYFKLTSAPCSKQRSPIKADGLAEAVAQFTDNKWIESVNGKIFARRNVFQATIRWCLSDDMGAPLMVRLNFH